MAARRAAFLVVLVAAAIGGQALAAELGTLFYTPQERERLDRLRRGEPVAEPDAQGNVPTAVPRVNGYIRRSDGRDTVFLDGRAYPAAGPKAASAAAGKAPPERSAPASGEAAPQKPKG